MSLLTNLQGYWKFNESSGNASDSSGNSNTLTNTNSATYVPAKLSNGASLAIASKQCFRITDAAQTGLDIAGDFTLSFWLKLNTQPGGDYPAFQLQSKWDETANQRSYCLNYQYTSGVYKFGFAVSANGEGSVTNIYHFNKTLTLDTWYHIVVTYDVSTHTATIYLNGSLYSSSSTGTTFAIYNSNCDFMVGAVYNATNGDYGHTDGVFDEFGIWSRVLDSGEVSSLYLDGVGLSYPFTLPYYEYYQSLENDYSYTGTTVWVGQTFTTTSTHTVTNVKLKLSNSGTTSLGVIRIYETSAGLPTGSPITTGTFDPSTIGTSPTLFDISVTPVLLVDATKYAIIIHVTSLDLPTNHVSIYYEATGGYSGGNVFTSQDNLATYNTYAYDATFQIWGGSSLTTTTTTSSTTSSSTSTSTSSTSTSSSTSSSSTTTMITTTRTTLTSSSTTSSSTSTSSTTSSTSSSTSSSSSTTTPVPYNIGEPIPEIIIMEEI
jgi:hypothetical protein